MGSYPITSCVACVVRPSQTDETDSTTHISFKSRARNQILKLRQKLDDERRTHEQLVIDMSIQHVEDVVSLRSRVECSESEWSSLQRRISELWKVVEGLTLPCPTTILKSSVSTQTLTQTSDNNQERWSKDEAPNVACHRDTSTSSVSTQTPENAHSMLGVKVAASMANQSNQWRAAFNHLSDTPQQRAVASMDADNELREWRAAFGHLRGTPAERAAASKAAAEEIQEWRAAFKHVSGTPSQRAATSRALAKKCSVMGTEIKDRRLEVEKRDTTLVQMRVEIRQLKECNMNLTAALRKEMSLREKFLQAVSDYERISISRNEAEKLTVMIGPTPSDSGTGKTKSPRVADPLLGTKRKREASEPNGPPYEAFPASQRRRVEQDSSRIHLSEGRWDVDKGGSNGRAQRDLLAGWRSPVSSAMSSISLLGLPTAPSSKILPSIPASPHPASDKHPSSGTINSNRALNGISRVEGESEKLSPGAPHGSRQAERTPDISLPVEKKWKYSMLRKVEQV